MSPSAPSLPGQCGVRPELLPARPPGCLHTHGGCPGPWLTRLFLQVSEQPRRVQGCGGRLTPSTTLEGWGPSGPGASGYSDSPSAPLVGLSGLEWQSPSPPGAPRADPVTGCGGCLSRGPHRCPRRRSHAGSSGDSSPRAAGPAPRWDEKKS